VRSTTRSTGCGMTHRPRRPCCAAMSSERSSIGQSRSAMTRHRSGTSGPRPECVALPPRRDRGQAERSAHLSRVAAVRIRYWRCAKSRWTRWSGWPWLGDIGSAGLEDVGERLRRKWKGWRPSKRRAEDVEDRKPSGITGH
jgi:hypothetical protein